jgi:hypothetical protein
MGLNFLSKNEINDIAVKGDWVFQTGCKAPGFTRNDRGTSLPCLFPPMAVKSRQRRTSPSHRAGMVVDSQLILCGSPFLLMSFFQRQSLGVPTDCYSLYDLEPMRLRKKFLPYRGANTLNALFSISKRILILLVQPYCLGAHRKWQNLKNLLHQCSSPSRS